jgi:uncharacterized protein YbjT (DUF2867 family)
MTSQLVTLLLHPHLLRVNSSCMKILLFGATGSAGGGVLSACIATSIVTEVRAITRRPLPYEHSKLWNIVHPDFLDYFSIVEVFLGIDACLFCLGTSITQVSEKDYQKITHDYALAAARTLLAHSPNAAFHYISGQGTKPGSRMFWSRIKAQTELELMDLIGADCWRPAFIDAPPSSSTPKMFRLLYPLARLLKPFPGMYIVVDDLAHAMLQATQENLRKRVIENPEIRKIAARFPS